SGTPTASGAFSYNIPLVGGCGTAKSATGTITVNDIPTIAYAGLDQVNFATCGLTTVTLAGNVPTAGTGKWTIVSGDDGVFTLDTDATTTFTGTVGTAYVLRWTISNMSCTDSTDDLNVRMTPLPETPVASVLAEPTCLVPTGSIVLSGLPSGDWIVNPGNIRGNTATTTITGLIPGGTYSFTVTSEIGCISLPSLNVTVGNVICANKDTSAAINGKDGGSTTVSVLDNDTLNGKAVVPSEVTLTPKGTYPTGITLNADGTITVTPGTPADTYEVEYTICEKLNPTNCSTTTVTVVVEQAAIVANKDTPAAINGKDGGSTTVSVLDNDTLNGKAVVPSEVTLTPKGTYPTGITLNADGTITVTPGTPADTYEVEYTICEKLNPTNCSTTTVTVPVTAAPIVANKDTPAAINGKDGGSTTVSVLDNDTLNGKAVVPSEVTLTPKGTYPAGITLNADGTITVTPGTPADTYEVEYTICEKLNPTNCSSTTVTVVVEKPVIDAVTETTDSINGITGGTTSSLISNDTLNGDKVVIGTNPGDVILTPKTVPTGLTLNPDGTVTVAPNTPAGNYNVEYQICEVTNPTNCDTVISVVVVGAAVIDAVDDNVIFADGINGSLEVINVLDNDRLNGGKISNPAVVTLKSLTVLSGITLNVDGTIDVAPNTPGGVYTLTYQICDVINRSNCITAKVTIFVEVPSIAVVKTAVFNDENKSGYANAGETITYKFKITNTGNTPLLNVIIDDQLPGLVMSGGPITLGVNEVDENSFIGTYVIKQSDINLGKISNQATVFGTSANGITVEDMSDNLSEVDDNPTVSPIEGCVIKVFNAISPNGDSRNERFYIQGLECYPDNTVEIYNRWGVLVFERDGYNNEERAFKGFSEGRTTVQKSEGLPVGTYYYVLKYKDSESNAHQKAGYLYINK
ncbi:gliding motility-associated C-terminal domain-containing protein, partial [Flavobacterium sp. LS1R47]